MALPKLNVPQYKVKLPSSGVEINMRPFLVKEEKVLMIALESQDAVQITTAVREIILHCTSLDTLDSLTTVDIEYLFLQLRAKSVGEKITLQTKCTDEECDGLTKIVLDIDDVKIINNDANKTIMLEKENGVGVTLNYPTAENLQSLQLGDDSKATDIIMDIIVECIDTIFDDNSVHPTKDVSSEEVRAFVDSLNTAQFNKIQQFFQDAPSIYYETKTNCLKCNKDIDIELKGLANFFG